MYSPPASLPSRTREGQAFHLKRASINSGGFQAIVEPQSTTVYLLSYETAGVFFMRGIFFIFKSSGALLVYVFFCTEVLAVYWFMCFFVPEAIRFIVNAIENHYQLWFLS